MKKIITKKSEIYEVYCDATNKLIKPKESYWCPGGIMKFEFGYGSKFDGMDVSFDLSDEVMEDILEMIKDKYPKIKNSQEN